MDAHDLDLTGKAALVTGGGGGIGRAITLCLADMGADVAIVEILPDRAEEVADQVRARGRRALPIVADVMDAAAVQDAVAATAAQFGTLDILVNNAGGVTRRPFLDSSQANWRRLIDLNLVSMLAATQAAVPVMIAGGRGGAIVNVSSIEGARAAPGYAVYAACKAGINNLTRTLALEFAGDGIRINTIAPDYTITPGTSGNFRGPVSDPGPVEMTAERLETIRRRIPLGRAGIDEECGRLAVFLASPMASYVTGTIIPVDGGTWASSGWIRNDRDDWVLPPEFSR